MQGASTPSAHALCRLTGVENVVAGAGNGDVVMINPDMKVVHTHRTNVMGGVTSLALSPDCAGMMVGTDQVDAFQPLNFYVLHKVLLPV